MSDIRRWSLVAANNNFAVPDGFPENMPRSETNNAAREMMRAIRLWYDDPEWLDLMVDTAGDPLTISFVSTTVVRVEDRDMTSYFPVGRLVRVSVGGASITYGYVVSAVFGTHTDVTLENMFGAGTVIPAGVDTLDVHHSSTLGKLAFQDAIDLGFYVPETADDEGIQGAVDAANAAGGGIVLMTDDAYTVDSTVTVKSNVVVYGAEFSSTTVTAAAGLVGQVFMMSDSSSLIGLTINTSAQVAASEAVRVPASVTEVYLRSLYIIQAQTHGVLLSGAGISRVFMGDLWIEDPGQSGVYIDDNGNDNDEIVLANVSVRDPGNDGSTIDVYGVRLAGKCVASNIHVTCDRASPQKQRGVYFVSRNDSGLVYARQCAVTNLRVEGTGNQAIGAEIGGSGNLLANSTMNLSGSSSRGVLIDNIGAAQVSDFHVVTNVNVTAADIGIQIAADADDNAISNCTIRGVSTDGIQIGGERNKIDDCILSNSGSGVGVEILSNAVDNLLTDCQIDNFADGISVDGSLATIHRNRIANCTDGIVEDSTGQFNEIIDNIFDGVTNHNGTGIDLTTKGYNVWNGNRTLGTSDRFYQRDNGYFATLETDVTGNMITGNTEYIMNCIIFGGLELNGPVPNGAHRWSIEARVRYSIDVARSIRFKLYSNSSVSLSGGTTLDTVNDSAAALTDEEVVLTYDGVIGSGESFIFVSWEIVGATIGGSTIRENSGTAGIYEGSNSSIRIQFLYGPAVDSFETNT